jgi:Arc/MetJ-type ribon-helix-helix transcriptional regulator
MTTVVPKARSKVAKVSISLPPALLAEIDRRAAESGGTRSEVIRELVERTLRAERERADVERWCRSYEEQPQTDDEVGFAELSLGAWEDLPWDEGPQPEGESAESESAETDR